MKIATRRWTILAFAVVALVRAAAAKTTPVTTYEYFKLSGSQWFYSGYRPSCLDTIEIKLRFVRDESKPGVSECIYCSRTKQTDGLGQCMSAYRVGDTGMMRIDRNSSRQIDLFLPDFDRDYVLRADYKALKATMSDGTTTNVLTDAMQSGPFTPGSVLAFFVAHTEGDALSPTMPEPDTNFFRSRVYYVKIYDGDGKLVRHFVPASCKVDGLLCYGMYDVETKVFRHFSGTCPPAEVGPAVGSGAATEVQGFDRLRHLTTYEYFKLSGSQWFYSGYRPSCLDTIEIKLRFVRDESKPGVSECIYCSRTKQTDGLGQCMSAYRVGDTGMMRIDRNSSRQIDLFLPDFDRDYVLRADYKALKATMSDGTTTNVLTDAMQSGPFTPGSVLAFFVAHTEGDALSPTMPEPDTNFFRSRVYYVKIYDGDGKLVRHFVPASCKVDGLLCYGMYDVETKVFRHFSGTCPPAEVGPAVGSGAATEVQGFDRLRHLDLTGEQWVYSGYWPADDDKVVMKLRLTSLPAKNQNLFCSRGTNGYGLGGDAFSAWLTADGPKFMFDRAKTDEAQSVVLDAAAAVGVDYVVALDAGRKKASVSGLGSVALGGRDEYAPGSAFAFFGSHILGKNLSPASSVATPGAFRFYSLKVFGADGTLKREYVPAADAMAPDGDVVKYGLYELQTKSFFRNCG
ncbi:MAG: hypothetical protein MJ138_03260, partial [Kiritimatiellae bacterium]|nr:hypothetical protein [Kiritimatiellia bacterium]